MKQVSTKSNIPSKIDTDAVLKLKIQKEWLKCSKDAEYFISKYVKIKHPKRGALRFRMFPFQVKTLRALISDDKVVILKNRQMGLSTLTSAYSLWLMLFKPYSNVLAVATKQKTAKNIIDKVRFAYVRLPSWLQTTLTEDNKQSMAFSNDSRIEAIARAEDAGRSEAASLVIVDEAAHINESIIEAMWTGIQPTVSTGGRLFVLSTPNGGSGWFHKIYTEAEVGLNGFTPIRLHWTMHPERDQAWRDAQTKELGERGAKQECDGAWLTAGDAVINAMTLEYYKDNFIYEPIEKTYKDGNLWIWEHPIEGESYAVASDVARGDGDDFSTFHVFKLTNNEQVAEYHGKLAPNKLGLLALDVAKEYNNALLIIENNGIGYAAIQPALDDYYENLYYTITNKKYADKQSYNNKLRSIEKKKVPGFTLSGANRQLVVEKLVRYFFDKDIIIHSGRLFTELGVFVYINNERAEAMFGYHDDLVLPLAEYLFIRDTVLVEQTINSVITKKALDYIQVISSNNTTGNYMTPQQKQVDEMFGWL